MTRCVWRPARDEMIAPEAAVVSSHPLASEAGIHILRGGGNAVDAAVAMGFCLAVVEPMGSSIAGHGQMLIHLAQQRGRTVALDYSHRAPKAARAAMFKVLGPAGEGNAIFEVEGRANLAGYLSAGVPGVASGLCRAHQLFGSLPLPLLLEPAIQHAESGFPVDWLTALCIAEAMPDLARHSGAAQVFLPDGCPPATSKRLVQSDLGRVLRLIAAQGQTGFSAGEVPQVIAQDMKKNGGLLGVEDFSDFEVLVTEPLRTFYRGYEILGAGEWGGAITALQILNILENFELAALPHNSPEYLHLVIESVRHACADRYRYLGDPEHVPVPSRGILSRRYAADIAARIDPSRAGPDWTTPVPPWAQFAEASLHDPWRYQDPGRSGPAPTLSPPSSAACTTHFGVIDSGRNMVCSTQTAAGSFGSRVVTPGTGILFSNAMAVFNPVPGAANSIAGFKRALNNMSPLIVLREGKPFFQVGAPGGRRILSCMVQLILNVIDHRLGLQEAVAAPRIDASEGDTYVDCRMEPATAEALERMGHSIQILEESPVHQAGFARPLGLLVDPIEGHIRTGLDVFHRAEARGF